MNSSNGNRRHVGGKAVAQDLLVETAVESAGDRGALYELLADRRSDGREQLFDGRGAGNDLLRQINDTHRHCVS
jgi:hypothetical protein